MSDFFQPGRTYAYDANGFTAPELVTLFQVVADTAHPETGQRMAFGWIRTAEDVAWSPYAEPTDEWPKCWTDVTTEEQSSRPAADATPGLTERQTRLLDAIRTHEGQWTTSRALSLYALTDPGVVQRGTARRDLDALHRAGHLVLVDEPDNKHYVLHRKDGR
ncbi:hypothetical protein [Streptomyces sp. NBC_01171]|uniref:hypothetical protein n=1 Tax=Streptomyces sp. NBC_01171 TaxID=2903757 RepID=UPI00386D2921|nr:hypothetical protein OG448_15045 [Streptomyces sp. NBC_01171]